MVTLKRSKSDGHFFILAGPSKGTWQLSPQGEQELRRHGVRLPQAGEYMDLALDWWHYLSDSGLIFIHGIEYERRNRIDDYTDEARSRGLYNSGLPLSLHIQRQPQPTWSLALELTAIPGDTLAEARRCRATALTLSDAPSSRTPLLQLQRATCPAPVPPQAAPYVLQWCDTAYQTYAFQAPCLTPGLNSSAQGNVFAESRERTWRRCLQGSSISFWGVFYWLAHAEHEPHWAGNAQRYGAACDGWQLWRLTTHQEQPIAWQAVADWLARRQIRLTRHAQRLELVTPPLAITPEGWMLIRRDQPLIVACAPPERTAAGLRTYLRLAATQVRRDQPDSAASLHRAIDAYEWDSGTRSTVVDESLFARWKQPQPGDYRIQMVGDAMVEPLLVRVLIATPTALAAPDWLQGLECQLKAPDQRMTLAAFSQNPSSSPSTADNTAPHVTTFSEPELAQLEWELKPCGLPVRMNWRPGTARQDNGAWRDWLVTSGEELTRVWREEIWPGCASARGVSLVLDANSFGAITCTVGLPDMAELADDHRMTPAQRTELAWLARCSVGSSAHPRVALPNDVRSALDALLTPTSASHNNAGIMGVIALLCSQRAVPAWVIPRLRRLFASDIPVRAPRTPSSVRPKRGAAASAR